MYIGKDNMPKKVIKVSVVMSIYNGAKTLELSINSIIKQTYVDWEFIIVNDGSTDNTGDLLNNYSAKYDNVNIITNDSCHGLAYSLNKAIAKSSGEYIARADADDFSYSSRLKEQVIFLEKNPLVSVVGTGASYMTKSKESVDIVMPKEHKEIFKYMYKDSPFIHSSVMMRRIFFIEVGGYNETFRRSQDYDLWCRGKYLGEYHNIENILIGYNVNSNAFNWTSFYFSTRSRFSCIDHSVGFLYFLFWTGVHMLNSIKNRLLAFKFFTFKS